MQQNRFFPITPYQRNQVLAAALDPDTSPRFHHHNTLCWAIRVKPGIVPRQLQRAFSKLTARHDSLRLRIVNGPQDWAAEIQATHPTGVIIEDHGDMSPEDQVAVLTKICDAPILAVDPVLFDMRLLRFGTGGDVILTRAQHAIIDSYSVAIVLEDLIKFALNLPVMGKAPSHGDFVSRRERLARKNAADKQAYWENALLPHPPPLNLGRQKKALPPLTRRTMGPTCDVEDILTPDASRHLAQRAEATGISAFAQIKAAFGDAVCDMGGQEETAWFSVLGRKDAALSTFVGAEMQALRVKYRAGSGAEAVQRSLSSGAEMMPSTAFDPSGPMGQLYHQFFLNIPNPTGRLSNSPFRKVFEAATSGGFSVGSFSFERVHIPRERQANHELMVQFHPDAGTPQASVVSDAAAWDLSEVETFVDVLNQKILAQS